MAMVMEKKLGMDDVEELVRRFTSPGGTPEEAVDKVCREVIAHERPFWLQDPAAERVGVRRNLLASVYPEKWELVRLACRDWLRDRSFLYEKPTADRSREVRESLGWYTFELPSTGAKDRDFQLARSLCYAACREVRSRERDVTECLCDAYSDGRRVVVAVKAPRELSPTRLHCIDPARAPPEAVEKFKERHPNWFVTEDGRVCAEVPRTIREPLRYIEEYVRKRWAA